MSKKMLAVCALLLALLIFFLLIPKKDQQDWVTFYYASSDYSYGQPNGAIGSETREVGRRKEDLEYLLALYLEGPFDPMLNVPFPGKNIDEVQTLSRTNGMITIALADLGVGMSDAQFNLSCAALSKTCLELTDAGKVKITSGERSVIMTRDNLMLFDESTSVEPPKTEERE